MSANELRKEKQTAVFLFINRRFPLHKTPFYHSTVHIHTAVRQQTSHDYTILTSKNIV